MFCCYLHANNQWKCYYYSLVPRASATAICYSDNSKALAEMFQNRSYVESYLNAEHATSNIEVGLIHIRGKRQL